MRAEVAAPPFTDAADAFERGNQGAARIHDALARRLDGCGAMAGDASLAEEFASAYDEAARGALAAVGDLVDAFAACGRLTTASLANHGHAENRSMVSGRTIYDESHSCVGLVSVLPCSVPSSLGGDPSGLPGWANWILDQVEGFLWPDADTERLRVAASAWRSAGDQVADLAWYCDHAIHALGQLRSPEVPIAVEVTERLADRCRAVADQCLVLARACDEYAAHVDEQRAAILDLVHDLLRDAVIIEGFGIVLGAFTVGGGAAAATAVNAARIAAAAPRLLRIVETLRTLASTCAAPLRLAATALHDVRLELAVFRRARVTIGSAHDAERLARVARVREIVHNLRLFDPEDLRGLSRAQVDDLLRGWPMGPAKHGEGVVYDDVANLGRHIRVMDGYPPGSRPNPVTWGPYAQISQNGTKIKIPLEGNPTL